MNSVEVSILRNSVIFPHLESWDKKGGKKAGGFKVEFGRLNETAFQGNCRSNDRDRSSWSRTGLEERAQKEAGFQCSSHSPCPQATEAGKTEHRAPGKGLEGLEGTFAGTAGPEDRAPGRQAPRKRCCPRSWLEEGLPLILSWVSEPKAIGMCSPLAGGEIGLLLWQCVGAGRFFPRGERGKPDRSYIRQDFGCILACGDCIGLLPSCAC